MRSLHRAISSLVALAGAGVAGCGDQAPGANVDAGDGAVELTQVSAFWLPIDSERFGASGLVAADGVCVGLNWDFSNLGMTRTRHCDDFVDGFPYAVVRAAVDGQCGAVWDYGPDAGVTGARGCIDPDFASGTAHTVDVTATITSPLFTGTIHVATP